MDRLFGWGPNLPNSGGATVGVLGVPIDSGNVVAAGARFAPASIRQASQRMQPPTTVGVDYGDVPPTVGNVADEELFSRVSQLINSIQSNGARPLLLGGDHSISFFAIESCQQVQDLAVLWFDAHTDFSDWQGGRIHNHKEVLRRISKLKGVRRIIQIGYRGYTVDDERMIDPNATVFVSAEIRSDQVQAMMAAVPKDMPCYISIDIDVLDPRWAPGTSTPVPGGPSPDEIASLLSAVARSRDVVGVDITEVNPLLDRSGATSYLGAWLLRTILEDWASCSPKAN